MGRRVYLVLLAQSLISFVIYVLTMWPTIGGGDSGELTAAAATFGVAHPPGYPLFLLLGKAMTFIPWGDIAWRVNLLSVFCAVGAQAFLFLFVQRWIGRLWLSSLTAGLFAFSPIVWRYAILAEVFALNHLFVTGLLYGVLWYLAKPSARRAYLLAFAAGLGLSNHHTLIFVAALLAIYVLWHGRRSWLSISSLSIAVGFFLLGLSPYLLLPIISASNHTLISWGDASTWQGFWHQFLRRDYGTFKLATEGSTENQMWYGIGYYFVHLFKDSFALGVAFPLVALAKWRFISQEPQWRLSSLLGFIFVFYLLVFHYLANLPYVDGIFIFRDILTRFWPMASILALLLMALGVHLALQWRPIPEKPLYAITGLLIALQIGLHYKAEDHSGDRLFTNYGHKLLAPLPDRAILFSLSDLNTNTIRYLQGVEGVRPDLKILDRSLMTYPWYKRIIQKNLPDIALPGKYFMPGIPGGFNLKDLFDANFDKGPIYITQLKGPENREGQDTSWQSKYELIPYGLTYRVALKGRPFDVDQYLAESEKFLVDPREEFKTPPREDQWDNIVYLNYWLAHHIRGSFLLQRAMNEGNSPALLRASIRALESLVEKHPEPKAEYFKHLGIGYHLLSKVAIQERSLLEHQMYITWKKYLGLQPEEKDQAHQDIVRMVQWIEGQRREPAKSN